MVEAYAAALQTGEDWLTQGCMNTKRLDEHKSDACGQLRRKRVPSKSGERVVLSKNDPYAKKF
jgi:hypothetical protein